MISKDKTGGIDFTPILRAQHAEFYAMVRPRRSLRKRHCLRCRKSITTIDARMCTDCRAIVNRSALLAQGF
jgi:dUTPase